MEDREKNLFAVSQMGTEGDRTRVLRTGRRPTSPPRGEPQNAGRTIFNSGAWICTTIPAIGWEGILQVISPGEAMSCAPRIGIRAYSFLRFSLYWPSSSLLKKGSDPVVAGAARDFSFAKANESHWRTSPGMTAGRSFSTDCWAPAITEFVFWKMSHRLAS